MAVPRERRFRRADHQGEAYAHDAATGARKCCRGVASPDGKYLYYAKRQGGFEYNAQFPLWQIARRDRKTSDEDVLLEQAESSFRPVLSPDGMQLLYVTRYETESGLRLRNLETGEDH